MPDLYQLYTDPTRHSLTIANLSGDQGVPAVDSMTERRCSVPIGTLCADPAKLVDEHQIGRAHV